MRQGDAVIYPRSAINDNDSSMTRSELEPGPSEVSLEATKITSNALALESSMNSTRILLTLASIGYIMKLHVAV